MPYFEGQVTISAPKDKVWAILADLSSAERYIASVPRSYYTSSAKAGVGASRVCELRPAGSITETIVEWKEGECYALEIIPGRIAPPFKKAIARFSLQAHGERTVVSFTYDYTLKFGALGRVFDILLVRSQLRKAVPEVLLGLKHYAETGQLVDARVIKRLKALGTSALAHEAA